VVQHVEIYLLGGFRVVVDGVDVRPDRWLQRRARDLVKLLALAPRRRMHREQVIEALWPERGYAAGGTNLRKAVHFARRALGGEEAIVIVEGVVQLAPGASVTVDCEEFEQDALYAQRSSDTGQFVKAAERYTGDLLPEDLYEPWAEEARANLRRKYLQVLRAGGQWERLVEVDRCDEAAHRAVIRQHLIAGDRASALECYERLTRILDEQLGLVPDAESEALYREALAQADAAPSSAEQRASVLLASALLCTHRGALDQAEKEASQARQLAAQAGLGRQLGEASAALGMVAHIRGRWRELFLGEFLDTVQRPPSMASYVFDAHLCLAEVWVYGGGGVSDGQAFASDLFAIADEYDSTHGRALASLVRGEASLLSGELDAANSDLANAVSLYQAVGAESAYALATARLTEVAAAAGDLRRADQLANRSLELAHSVPIGSHIVVRILGVKVDLAQSLRAAIVAVQEGEEQLAGHDACGPCSMPFRVAAAITFAKAGDLHAAASYVDAARSVAAMWPGSPWEAAAWEARAALRLAEGRREQATALLEEASDVYARSGHSLAVARCRRAAAHAIAA
jgi:DNA-binding SARP family transcriptional activator